MSPTIDEDGTVFFGSWDNYLYAIDGLTSDEGDDTDLYVGEESNQGEKTPGFQIIIIILAISAILYFRKRRGSNANK